MTSQTILHIDEPKCPAFPIVVKREQDKESPSQRMPGLTNLCFKIARASSPHLASGLKIKSEPNHEDKGDASLISSQALNEVPSDGMQKIVPKENFWNLPEEQAIKKKIGSQYFEDGTKSDGIDLNDMNEHPTQQQDDDEKREAIDMKSIENDAQIHQSNEEHISLKRSLSFTNVKEHIPLYHKSQTQETEPTKLLHEKPWYPRESQREHYSLRDYENIRNYPTLLYPTTKDRTEFHHYDKMNNRLETHMRGFGLFGIPPEYRFAIYDKFYPPIPDGLKTRFLYMPEVMETSSFPVNEEVHLKAYKEEMRHRAIQTPFVSAFKKPAHHEERVKGMKSHEQEMKSSHMASSFLPYFNEYSSRERSLDRDFKREEEQNEHRRTLPEEYRSYNSNVFVMQPKLDISTKDGNYRSLKDFSELSNGRTFTERPYLSNKPPIFQDEPHQEAKCMYPCCANGALFADVRKERPLDIVPSSFVSTYASLPTSKTKRTFHTEENITRKSSFEEFLAAEREAMAKQQKVQKGMEENACDTPSMYQNTSKQILDANVNNKHIVSAWNHSKDGPEFYKQLDGKTPRSGTQSKESLAKDKLQSNEKETNVKMEQNFQGQADVASLPGKPSTQDGETAQKKISCSVCNKTFNRTSNLYTHMRTHSAHKPHACEFCGKRFHQKADLRIHRYIHTGEKPHKCTKCGRGFKQLTHLKYHMRTHSDVRMYKCPYCEKGFNQKSNLQAHIFGHTGQRPHKCDICGKGFTLASTLNTHKRTHLPNKPFKCQFCERAFYQKNALKMHYVSTHPYSSGAV